MQNSNLAYDLALFENRQRRTRPVVEVVKPAQTAAKNSAQTLLNTLCCIALAVVVVAFLFANIYSRVQLSETRYNITDAETTLTKLQSEETRLSAELDNKISIKNIETFATAELGLSRMESYQVTYLNLATDDIIKEAKQVDERSLEDKINDLFYDIVEYLN